MMDYVGAFHDYLARTEATLTADGGFQISVAHAVLQDAQVTVLADCRIVYQGRGLVNDGVATYEADSSAAQPPRILVTLRLDRATLAMVTRERAVAGTLSVHSSRSWFALCSLPIERLQTPAADPVVLRLLECSVERALWGVDAIFVHNGHLHVLGWAIPPRRESGLPGVRIDDAECEVERVLSKQAEALHWFLPDAQWLGFHAIAPHAGPDRFVRIDLAFAEDQPPTRNQRRFPTYNWVGDISGLKLPNKANISRVSGPSANQYSYLNGGHTDFHRFKMLISQALAPRPLGRAEVLDWGVGCGRIARYFVESGVKVCGVDIDEGNIAWCRENLAPGRFEVVNLLPPLPFRDGQFDAILSSSVLSHLTQSAMHAWLAELQRVLTPGGVALLSYNGDCTSYAAAAHSRAALNALETRGYFDDWLCADLDGHISDPAYYRFTLMTDRFAARAFGEHFHVEAQVRGVVSGGQNVAVLRRR